MSQGLSLTLHKWLTLLSVVHVCLLFFTTVPFFATWAVEHGMTEVQVGVVYATHYTAQCITLIVLALVPLKKSGLRFYSTLLCSAQITCAFCTVCFGMVPFLVSEPHTLVVCFCLVRILTGTCLALNDFSASLILQRLCPDHFGEAMSQWEIATGLGIVIGPPIGGLLYHYAGFLVPFVVAALACATYSTVYLYLVLSRIPSDTIVKKEEEHESSPESAHKLKIGLTLLRTSSFSLTAFVGLLTMSSLGFVDALVALYMDVTYGVKANHMGFINMAIAFTYMGCMIVLGHFVDKTHKPHMMIVGVTLIGISMPLIGPAPFLPRPPLMIESYLVTGFALLLYFIGFSLAYLPTMPQLIEVASVTCASASSGETQVREFATAFGGAVLTFAFAPGSVVGASLVQRFGFPWAYTAFGVIMLALGLPVLLLPHVRNADHRSKAANNTTDENGGTAAVGEFEELQEI